MTRRYVRKRWGSKERRIEAAVRLRGEGLSLREIAKRLKISHPTVMRDLAKWDERHERVVHLPGTNVPRRGENVPADVPEDVPLSQVILLAERRRA